MQGSLPDKAGGARRRPLPRLREGGTLPPPASARGRRRREADGPAGSKKCQGDAVEDAGRTPGVRGRARPRGGSPQAAEGPTPRREAPAGVPKGHLGCPERPDGASSGPYPFVRGAAAGGAGRGPRAGEAAGRGRAGSCGGGRYSPTGPRGGPSPSSRCGGHERPHRARSWGRASGGAREVGHCPADTRASGDETNEHRAGEATARTYQLRGEGGRHRCTQPSALPSSRRVPVRCVTSPLCRKPG